MQRSSLYLKYKGLLDALKNIIDSSQGRVLQNDPDSLFSDNVNFFVKSYLISACTYLEAYLQEVSYELSHDICGRLNSSKIPHNFINWRILKEVKDKNLKYAYAEFKITKKDISDEISANPYKTIKLFQFLGVDLFKQNEFVENKDVIGAVVTKRNNIVHLNDSANDVSFSDVTKYIDNIVMYMEGIDKAVMSETA